MMRKFYRISENEYKPTIIARGNVSKSENKLKKLLLRSVNPSYKSTKFKEMRLVEVKSSVGVHDTLGYFFNKAWAENLNNYDIYFCVGGSAHSALPLYKNKKKYSIWIATPYLDDRLDRREKMSKKRYLIDKLFYPIGFRQEKNILHAAYQVLGLSTYTKEKLKTYYSLPDSKVSVVPYPVDTDFFCPEDPEHRECNIIFTGRLNDPRKNIDFLIQAFAKIKTARPESQLILIGEELSHALKSEIHKLGLSDSIININYVNPEELVRYYQQASVFVIPSNQEGLCISGLEALASGLPIVSTDCGGPQEFVYPNENGFIVPKDDVEAMSSRVIQILNNPSLHGAMCQKSRELALNNFSDAVIAPQFIQALERLNN